MIKKCKICENWKEINGLLVDENKQLKSRVQYLESFIEHNKYKKKNNNML